ncbi:hypothetical protein KFL_002460150 [Klebsormidium nitens]|uniref:Plastid lipid-associated protein/fibrillin conserved domain-containing protein n=1 Tax=Klebsormidium nitens TaxID=105231 RepID=A0A1Y1I3X8_KLENI|nr:hypothetical protein KFL_002460150 [Klebsormidium nitens]|eukprot:GAQ85640.1 hypothetical protein KFL_002460150 [Klebsormidium nitens]
MLDSWRRPTSQSVQVRTRTRAVSNIPVSRRSPRCDKFLTGSSFEGLRDLGDSGRSWNGQQGPARHRRGKKQLVRAAVSTGTKGTASDAGVKDSVALLKEAAKTRKVEGGKVTQAIIELEKAKVDSSKFLEYIGGTASPGHHWMLVFTAGSKDVQAAKKGGKPKGSYIPITAVQHFDAQTNLIENGVYLRSLGNLVFAGVFGWKNRQLSFTFDRISIKLGPLKPFSFKLGSGESRVPGVGKEGGKDPFFLFSYADDEIMVARGRGGGVAFWVRCKNVGSRQW